MKLYLFSLHLTCDTYIKTCFGIIP